MLKIVTLCHIIDPKTRRILLGRKKRGFGVGKLNGFGGKIEPGESEREAAVREVHEEAGIEIRAEALRRAGKILFYFPYEPAFDHEVHLFATERWAGEPQETSEMAPAWFDLDAIPYEEMWADDPHWMPLVLSGKTIEATFTFSEDNETVAEYDVREVGLEES